MNGYICIYKGKRIEVRAKTILEAQTIAAKTFKARKAWEVNVGLAELADGTPYIHTATE